MFPPGPRQPVPPAAAASDGYGCISGNVNELYEKDFYEVFAQNKNHKYTGTQPELKKLTKLDDIVNTAEQALFQIYGEDQIKGEQPYNISKYKNK